MTKSVLMKYVGKTVIVTLFDSTCLLGKLGYVNSFSDKFNYRKPNYFFINHTCFKVSHVSSIHLVEKN